VLRENVSVLKGMGTITLSDRQKRQVRILQKLADNTLIAEQAAQLLGKSVRQVWRLTTAFQNTAMAAVQGNKGRESANKTDERVLDQVPCPAITLTTCRHLG
jgi:hypothetical protein